jgi:CheY-like chemotaxis protein
VCADPATTESVRSTLKELGYKSHTAESAEIAIERLRYTPYDVIVMREDFAGSSLHSNSLLNYLAGLPMPQRRLSFTCVIGESFKTLDAMQAFAHSVHLVVNPQDLANLAAILKKSTAEFEILYAVYKDAAASMTGR